MVGLRRVEPRVRKLHRAPQPLPLGGAETVHADHRRRVQLPHQRRRQLLKRKPGGRRHPGRNGCYWPQAPHRRGSARAHGDKDALHRARAKGIGGDAAVAHPQHQYRPFRRQKGPQLPGAHLDDGGVPLVQHADAGHFQRHIPAPGAAEPLAGDLHPCHRDSTVAGGSQPHPCGQRLRRAAEQLVSHIRSTHFPHSPFLFWGKSPPYCRKVWEKQNFSKQKSKKRLRWYAKYGIIGCAVIGSQGGGTNA